MYFASDNWAGVYPAISASLSEQAGGYSSAYGTSDLDREVERRFSEIFERDVAVFFVATGTAANSLALTSVAKPGGLVFAHREAHIVVDECGAPEYLSGQLRITTVDGPNGKIDTKQLRRQIERSAEADVHSGRPNAISVTQATEAGTVYSLAELDAIAAVAKDFDLPLHMDGARFANALVSLGCTPAEMTWKSGVDMLSFGATKNGCWCAEAVVLFDTTKASDFGFIRKRAAQLFSKSRFISAQFDAYFRDGLWLDLARQTNSMAAKLAETFVGLNSARLVTLKPQSNQVFAIINNKTIAAIRAQGAVFYDWPASSDLEIADNEQLCRFVTSFATTAEDISRFRGILQVAAIEI
jgi:threonine aldolase